MTVAKIQNYKKTEWHADKKNGKMNKSRLSFTWNCR